MADGSNTVEQYAFAKLGQEFVDDCRQFELNCKYTAEDRGLWQLWWLIYCASLGIDPRTGDPNATQRVRMQQQYALFRVQLMRRLISQRIMLAKDQRPSFVGVATNNDVESLAQVNISSKAIEYMLTEAKLEEEASDCLQSLGYYGGGALLNTWDYNGGQLVPAQEPETDPETGEPMQMPVLDPQTGEPTIEQNPETGETQYATYTPTKTVQKKSGCPKILKLYPWQYARDPYQEKGHLVCITKRAVNKYELAAKFPEKAQDIVKCSIDTEMGDDALFAWGGRDGVSSDTVILREVWHANCEAVPGGRYACYVSNIGLLGVDEVVPCPLDEGIPVKFMVSGGARYWGTAFGYPESSDLLALQTVVNEAVSQSLTNMIRRGNANAYKRSDMQIDQRSFSRGGMLFEKPPGIDKAVEWDDPPEIGSLAQYIIEFVTSQAEQQLGGNATSLGKPDANITSGAFAVLMVNIAQKYASDMQEAYDNAITETANDALELTRKNAQHGFWAEIAGIADQPYLELITQDKLQSLKRVKLVRQSPVLSTYQGRELVFDRLVGLPKRDRADASEMLLSGRMDAFCERDQASKIRIRKEHEYMLQTGKPATVGFTDDHALEGPEHRAELDKLRTQLLQMLEQNLGGTPECQKVEQQCAAFQQHIEDHALALAATNVPTAITCGWQPLMMGAGGAPAAEQQKQAQAGKPKPPGSSAEEPKPPNGPKPPQQPGGLNAPMGERNAA